MAVSIDIRILELLAARLCHDLAGPIAAITNGAELLDDEDPDFVRQAGTLIGDSAGTAAKRLQLFRFVYGFNAGSLAGPPPHLLACEYFAGGSVSCDYGEAVRAFDGLWQRLGCALLLLAGEGLPRGGRICLKPAGEAVTVTADGEGARLSDEATAALLLQTPVEALSSRTVGAYFAGLLARQLDHRLNAGAEPTGFRISCEKL
jgi:histidine phosphotransferase ChpT